MKTLLLLAAVALTAVTMHAQTPQDRLPKPSLRITTQGTTAAASTVEARLDPAGRLAGQYGRATTQTALRVRVCNNGTYTVATNASLAVAGSCTVVETHTANKDLTILATTAAPSLVLFTVTDATAETVTVRLGPPVVGGKAADYGQALQVTHAAPAQP